MTEPGAPPADAPAPPARTGATRLELEVGPVAAGGACVARAGDGRVVFVRHALPGERVRADVTADGSRFLRADAVEILAPSPDRVVPPCPYAGPGRCGGCDWQHATLAAQRRLKAELVAEQLRRGAGVDTDVSVEAVPGDHDGLGWRTRVQFAVDPEGRVGLHRHRSHTVEPVDRCLIAAPGVEAAGVERLRWPGVDRVEVATSTDGDARVVSVTSLRRRRPGRLPAVEAGLIVDGRTLRPPRLLHHRALGRRFDTGPGVFWQVHPGAAAALAGAVLEGLGARPGDRLLDLYAGAGLFAAVLAPAVGPDGAVVAVEGHRRAAADAARNCADLPQVAVVHGPVNGRTVAAAGPADLVVLDPPRRGAGREVIEAVTAAGPRAVAYVACDPAAFARDLRTAAGQGWHLAALRAFDLFPMTEHVELVAVLRRRTDPAGGPAVTPGP